ncbi:MAG: hypothetical protein ACKVXR_00855 [Planctomycetota bacterium]
MTKTRMPATWALLAALAAACSSTSNRLDRMYASLKQDIAEHGGQNQYDPGLAQRHAERAAAVREMVEAGDVKEGMDRFHAAVLLVESDDLGNLELSERLALQAAEQGVELGRRVAAEAIDKQLVRKRLPQRYGTQYEWVVVLRAWRLFPIDPTTTDADRRAMGVPTLAEIRAGEEKLNAASGAR